MTSSPAPELDLTMRAQFSGLPDERRALEFFPGLRTFRAHLGNTPLVEVPGPAGGARILAKYEFQNPFGSVKDRAAYALLCQAVNDYPAPLNTLRIADASSGNMGRALSGLGHVAGIPIRLISPSVIPRSLLDAAHEAGAEVDLVDASRGLVGLIKYAEQLRLADPGLVVLEQLLNMANVSIHQFMTGPEIIANLGSRRPSAWVASVGSGGTIAGVGRALRERYGAVQITGVTPAELPFGTDQPPNGDPKIAGAAGLGYGYRQPFVAGLVPDTDHRQVAYWDAIRGMRTFRDETGTSIGASSAANWLTACRVAEQFDPDEIVVTLFGDAGPPEDWQKVADLDD